MPELPEVETIKNELLHHVVGRQFIGVVVYDEKPIRQPAVGEFSYQLVGQKIKELQRRGKYLMFHLSSGQVLVVHLRMTGALLLNPEGDDRFARVVFQLNDGSRIVFSDRRRLGVIYLAENDRSVVDKLGPEPLTANFTAKVFAQRLKRRQSPIKAILLDQGVVAGIGNMYADEALFAAKIHPLRIAGDLSYRAVQKLYEGIVTVLRAAIESKGASVDTYKRPGGDLGTAHDEFKVAHRRNEKCLICGTAIQRIIIRNRGTYFCPNCQKL
jgi:formamidopyrimidine-DNA glycosylase